MSTKGPQAGQRAVCVPLDRGSSPAWNPTSFPVYMVSPLGLGAESEPADAAGTPDPAPKCWLVGPELLQHSPHRYPAVLARALAGDMLPAGDSVDGDWKVQDKEDQIRTH